MDSKMPKWSLREFLETQPLYTKVNLTTPEAVFALSADVVYLHCEICNDTRPFRFPRNSITGHSTNKDDNDGIHRFHFVCTGCQAQSFICWVQVSRPPKGWIQKIGQYPSFATLYSAKLKRYRKVLTPEDYNELRRAVGLAAHGIGIGAFVYLRRIFERLIEEAHQIVRQDAAWDEDLFLQSRMPEKIALLASHLPSFLVENKSLYGILSKGIHDLSEDECLQFFLITQLGIELILEERIATKEKNERIEQATKGIALLTQKIKEQSA
jgi:hypothetical protein